MILTHLNKKGDIGLVYFYVDEILPMSDEQRQQIIDQDSRAAMYAMLQSHVMNPGQPVNVQAEYERARRDGAKRAEQLRINRVVKQTYHQIGQKESVEELLEIERREDFRGWYDPELVSLLVSQNDDT